VERTFAWILRNRGMSRDYKFLPETGEALIVTMIRLMLKQVGKRSRMRASQSSSKAFSGGVDVAAGPQ
jgi:hypothetical protein